MDKNVILGVAQFQASYIVAVRRYEIDTIVPVKLPLTDVCSSLEIYSENLIATSISLSTVKVSILVPFLSIS